MSSIRRTKKEIDALVAEIVSDAYTCLIINKKEKQEEIFDIIQSAVDLRRDLYGRVNNPAEKHNPKLLKKHYIALRAEMFDSVDKLFARLSAALKA